MGIFQMTSFLTILEEKETIEKTMESLQSLKLLYNPMFKNFS